MSFYKCTFTTKHNTITNHPWASHMCPMCKLYLSKLRMLRCMCMNHRRYIILIRFIGNSLGTILFEQIMRITIYSNWGYMKHTYFRDKRTLFWKIIYFAKINIRILNYNKITGLFVMKPHTVKITPLKRFFLLNLYVILKRTYTQYRDLSFHPQLQFSRNRKCNFLIYNLYNVYLSN